MKEADTNRVVGQERIPDRLAGRADDGPCVWLRVDHLGDRWLAKVIRLWAGSNPVDRGRDVTEAAKGRSASRPAWEGGEGQRADVSTAPVVPEPAAGAVDERDRRDVREQHLIALAQPAVQAVFTDHHRTPPCGPPLPRGTRRRLLARGPPRLSLSRGNGTTAGTVTQPAGSVDGT